MKNRAQVFSGEFLGSYVIFFSALIIVLYLWNSNLTEINATEKQQDMNDLGVQATEQLIRTPGSPRNWTLQNYTVLGLANESRVLQQDKIKSFVVIMSVNDSSLCPGETNYDCNRHLMGLGRYDFAFNMTYLNGTSIKMNNTLFSTGRLPANDTRRITVVRTALLEDNMVRIIFTLWSK